MQSKLTVLLSISITLALLVAGGIPAVADPDKDEAHGKEHRRSSGQGRGHYREHSYFHEHGYANLGIPEGHLPPPGECRIWYPGKPAGHQPPPGTCGRVRQHVPAGAWLIERPGAHPQHVDVTVYDASRPGIVISIGIFEAHTGDFIGSNHAGTSRLATLPAHLLSIKRNAPLTAVAGKQDDPAGQMPYNTSTLTLTITL